MNQQAAAMLIGASLLSISGCGDEEADQVADPQAVASSSPVPSSSPRPTASPTSSASHTNPTASPAGTPGRATDGPAKDIDAPVLLVNNSTSHVGHTAIVSGVLKVNTAGCFALGDLVLVAPAGSRVLPDGQGVVLAGIGEYRIGDMVRGGGGMVEDYVSAKGYKRCLSRNGPARFGVINEPAAPEAHSPSPADRVELRSASGR